jgi:hypothetical protein
MFNDHHGCVCHVDSDFHHRGRDQHIDLPPLEAAHDDLFLVRVHPPMQQTQAQALQSAGFQGLVHVRRGFERGTGRR